MTNGAIAAGGASGGGGGGETIMRDVDVDKLQGAV